MCVDLHGVNSSMVMLSASNCGIGILLVGVIKYASIMIHVWLVEVGLG